MKSLVSFTLFGSAFFAFVIVGTVSAELPQLKLVTAYPNLKLQEQQTAFEKLIRSFPSEQSIHDD